MRKAEVAQHASFVLSIVSTCAAGFAGGFSVINGFGTVSALAAIAVAWALSTRANRDAAKTQLELEQLRLRTKVEHGTAAAFHAQGELATWNYDRVVKRLREDGHIR